MLLLMLIVEVGAVINAVAVAIVVAVVVVVNVVTIVGNSYSVRLFPLWNYMRQTSNQEVVIGHKCGWSSLLLLV